MDKDRLRERIIQLTRDLILIESTDDLPSERRRCFQLMRNHLEEVPGLNIRMAEKNGYESLIALPEGKDVPEILLCGHLDVVKHIEPGSYRSEIRDGKIYGPGAGDMKGQLAIMIELIRHLVLERFKVHLATRLAGASRIEDQDQLPIQVARLEDGFSADADFD